MNSLFVRSYAASSISANADATGTPNELRFQIGNRRSRTRHVPMAALNNATSLVVTSRYRVCGCSSDRGARLGSGRHGPPTMIEETSISTNCFHSALCGPMQDRPFPRNSRSRTETGSNVRRDRFESRMPWAPSRPTPGTAIYCGWPRARSIGNPGRRRLVLHQCASMKLLIA
jgi:hypothetical protein